MTKCKKLILAGLSLLLLGAAVFLFCLFDAGIVGAALVTPVCALAVIAYGTMLLRKKGIPLRLHADNWDRRHIKSRISDGCSMPSLSDRGHLHRSPDQPASIA